MTIANLRSPIVPPSLAGWISLAESGFPRYWLTVWQSIQCNGLAPGTVSDKLSAVDRLYRHVEDVTGSNCLDRILGDGDIPRLEMLLEAFFIKLRNVSSVNGANPTPDWRTAFDFVRDICERQAQDISPERFEIFRARLQRLDRLYGTLSPARKAKRKVIRALPASVVEDLYEIALPGSSRNPFRNEGQRWRNWCLFLIYLHQGLRRGEALILPANAIKEDFDRKTGESVSWINIVETIEEDEEEADPQYDAPRIKTDQSRRQIPIASEIADTVNLYVENYRGRQDHPYLFVSNRASPLGVRRVNRIFQTLSEALSPGARKDLENRQRQDSVTPHSLRHTCAVYRLAQFVEDGMEMAVALQALRAFFGWSRASTMPQHYASAYFEDRLRTVWQSKFDERVSLLRNLSRIEDVEEPFGGPFL